MARITASASSRRRGASYEPGDLRRKPLLPFRANVPERPGRIRQAISEPRAQHCRGSGPLGESSLPERFGSFFLGAHAGDKADQDFSGEGDQTTSSRRSDPRALGRAQAGPCARVFLQTGRSAYTVYQTHTPPEDCPEIKRYQSRPRRKGGSRSIDRDAHRQGTGESRHLARTAEPGRTRTGNEGR